MAEITYKKLRDDTWGLYGPEDELVSGQEVTVTKRDGTEKTETVAKVLWTGDGKAIATIEQKAEGPQRATPALRAGARAGARICSCTEPGCDCHRGHTCKCAPHCVCRGGNVFDCG